MIHIEGSRVTGQGGKHNRSKSNRSPDGARMEYNEGSPTEIAGNILGRCHERNSDRGPNVPRGEERDDESGRQVDCLSDAHWPDQ